jgi:hypothetical protein
MWTDTGVLTFDSAERGSGRPSDREAALRTLTIAVVAALFAACAPSKEVDVARARLAAERRNLEATFEALEDRLVVNQARVRFWKEMRDRHESVTAVACATNDRHAEDMARVLNRNLERYAAVQASRVRGQIPAHLLHEPHAGRGGAAD